ncbi:MAG: tRNA (5-methylaminomethyl-2-thiouridine)(34)-methyltransferase MnmD [Chloroflexota bacterium]
MNTDKPAPKPTKDGFDTLYSPAYQQTFHSIHGALTESNHIYLEGTGVKARLAQQKPTRILEVGFGTGLNFFLTAERSLDTQTPLYYVALEKELLSTEILVGLNHTKQLPAITPLYDAFLAWRSQLTTPLAEGHYQWSFETIDLQLMIGDATQATILAEPYHAIYHDAFSPDANPELWTPDFFAKVYAGLLPGGKLATYSVKGTVRRALQTVGFHVEKQPGPPGKREIVVATKG